MNARQAEALAARAKLPETEKRTAEKDGDLEEISSFMTRNLGLKVKISAGRGGGGKVVLQYANPADLDKIIDMFADKVYTDKRHPAGICGRSRRLKGKAMTILEKCSATVKVTV